ncbi:MULTISPECIES: helix-turn-helix domain-containing protein [unclassified Chelatococcus]|uniref:helix-turn-helix transcriptional regulator n=1 Tax=unclassified Chelatococcus TaxID=2638111 RepID=UPI0025B7D87C|nr:helix-turn-helix domain-containing protein [Chelatococcus sp.]
MSNIASSQLPEQDLRDASDLRTVSEVGTRLGLSISTLNSWRSKGRGPRFVKVGSRVRYRDEDVTRWLIEHTRQST